MSDLDSRGMMKAIYDVISQPSGERDWESIRPLYHPRATMTRTGVAIDTLPANKCLTFDEYIKTAEENLAGASFEEVEIGHECTRSWGLLHRCAASTKPSTASAIVRSIPEG
jgi:hypothetical protein